MDTEVLVENHFVDDGYKLLLELVRDDFDVAVALWVKTSEEGLRFLYIASPSVEPAKIGDAYRRVYVCLNRIPISTISLSEIKLVHSSNPIAVEAMALREKSNGGDLTIRYPGKRLGHMAIEAALIYRFLPAKKQPISGELRRLKRDVKQVDRPEDYLLTHEERATSGQIVASGVNPIQAEEWVRKWREIRRPKQPIPAGTVVKARVAAHWGAVAGDDPNPLLMVEAPDGAQGLTFKEDTEPV
jgi:hypothetical protein